MAWGECSLDIEQRKKWVGKSYQKPKEKMVRASGIAAWDVPTGMDTKCKNLCISC